MSNKRSSALILGTAIFISGLVVAQTIFGASSVTSSVTVGNSPPSVSSVTVNNGNSITLTANATTTVNVNATITDNNGCGDINPGTTTILLYRAGVSSSTCIGAPNNASCYLVSAFNSASTCSGISIVTTSTFGIYYFAQATDASSSFPSDGWKATVIFSDPQNATGSSDSPNVEVLTLTALNVTTSSINYGTLGASSTTGGVNQTTAVANVGNSSSTLNLSGTALSSGANSIATSSQHYATSTFTFGGAEQSLQTSPTNVPGFKLTNPTSLTPVSSTVFWGFTVPAATPTGTYSGVNNYAAVFTP